MRSIMRGKTNEFGQRVLDSDYRADDLNRHRQDVPVGETSEREHALHQRVALLVDGDLPHGGHAVRQPGTLRIAALLDLDAPAKEVRHAQGAVIDAKNTRHTVTREPDVFDEVAGEAVWVGTDTAVIVPVESLNDFRRYVSCRGMSTIGRGTFRLEVLAKTDKSTWELIQEAVA